MEIWGMRSTSSKQSLPGPLSMGQIDVFKIIRITENCVRTPPPKKNSLEKITQKM